MSSTRSIISPPPFASTALTVIPPTPVAGVTYRDETAGPASSPDGWPYAERVNSAEWNQIMYQLSSLVSIMDHKGVLGWSDLVDYSEASVQFGSDGILYAWLQASGPSLGGAKDPVSNPTYWKNLRSGQLIGVQTFAASGTYTPSSGMATCIIEAVGAGGGAGSAVASGAGQVSIPGGGSSGAYALGKFTAAAIGASQAVTIGVGGVGGVGGPGGSGSSTSVGALIVCPGGLGSVGHGPATPPIMKAGALVAAAPTGGNIKSSTGNPGGNGFALTDIVSGPGGSSPMFSSGGAASAVANTPGTAGLTPGSGGSGGCSSNGAARNGGAGANGYVLIWEFY